MLLSTGMKATVVEVRPGRRGTGRLAELHDGDEPFVDSTRDGYSVVEVAPGFRRIALQDSWVPA